MITLILLVVTRTFTELAERAKLPALVGELMAGIILGFLLGLYAFPLIGRYFRRLSFPEVDFSMLLIGALAYAVLLTFLLKLAISHLAAFSPRSPSPSRKSPQHFGGHLFSND